MIDKRKTKWAWARKFYYALRGVYTSLKEENSLVVHFVIATFTLILSAIFHSYLEMYNWLVLILVIGIVISNELLNTSVENLVDLVAFKYNFNAKKIKDVAAASTFVLSLTAIAIGLCTFIPVFIKIINHN